METPSKSGRVRFAADLEVGDGVTLVMYSDRHAYTVIAKTPKTVTIQRDKCTLLNGMNSDEPDKLQFSPGGFVGHVSGIQRWKCEPDPDGGKVVMRETKKGLRLKGTPINHGRYEYYDYNF